MPTRLCVIGLCLATLTAACDRSSGDFEAGEVSRSWNPSRVAKVGDVPATAVRAAIRAFADRAPDGVSDEQVEHAEHLYRRYQGGPLWLDDDGVITERASALVDALVNASGDAMILDQYPLVGVAYALDTLRRVDHPTAEQLARADWLLTVSFVALGEDYLRGQIDPRSVSQSWHIDRPESRVDSALARSIADKDLAGAIARMRPQDYDYEMLRRKLSDYRRIATSGGFPVVPAGKALGIGDAAPPARLEALRTRLRTEGYDVDGNARYDRSFAAAIAQFQQRHGIEVDSTLGQETLDALNVTAAIRAAQIAANLERRRWMPRALGDRYVFVNVPAFQLQAFEGGKMALEMKVIVGAEYQGRATPAFSDSMQYVVFRPYWDVPPSIAEKELLPHGLPADFEMTTRGGEPHVRQLPGPKNALGLVKFLFPNDFNIYLHDTPGDNLFDKDVRAFSHGCIRLEKPDQMAAWVLGWSIDRVRNQMNDGPNDHQVTLQHRIPVYIGYYTAYMRDGELWFGNDLYHRDDTLVQAVAAGAFPSARAVKAIEILRKLTD